MRETALERLHYGEESDAERREGVKTDSRERVVLLQLPPPARCPSDFPNVPLAAGYLAASARARGIGGRFDIEILTSPSSDLWGDGMIVKEIVGRRPRVAGFSLYPWNCTRSLFIAEEIRKRCEDILILVGGSESTAASPVLLGSPAWDVAVMGEGEGAFCEILERLSSVSSGLDDVGGLLHRRNGVLCENPPRAPLKQLDGIPSPYLEGILRPRDYGYLWMETARGCPFRCAYCSEWKRGGGVLSSFSPERVAREFEYCLQEGARKIFILDSAFNLSPRFRETCERIAEMNKNGLVSLHATLRPEVLDGASAKLLKGAGVTTAELGLQCTDEKALRTVRRTCDPEGYLRGANLLREEGIRVFTDVMVGIPGQTREGLLNTIELLKKEGIGRENAAVFAFPLSVCPGTELRERAQELSLVHQSEPPYYALKSGELGFEEIRGLLELYRDAFPNNRFDRGPRRPFLTTTSEPSYPHDPRPWAPAGEESSPVVYMEVLPSQHRRPAEEWRRLGEELSPTVGERLTVLVGLNGDAAFLEGLRALLVPVSRVNPFLVWSFLWEVEEPVPIEHILEIGSALHYRAHSIDYQEVFRNPSFSGEHRRRALIHSILVPHVSPRMTEAWLEGLDDDLYVFRKLHVTPETDVGKEIGELRERRWRALWVDYSPSCGMEFVLRSLDLFRECETAERAVHFRNWVLHRFFHFGEDLTRPACGNVRFGTLDDTLAPLYGGLHEEKLLLDEAEWMLRVKTVSGF